MGNTHVSSVELPQDARLREIILGDEGAFKAWKRILGKVVKPAELERLLLEALRPSANTPNLHRISVRETEQAIARIQRVIQDAPRLNMEYSDMLPGPPPPLGSRLGPVNAR